MRRILFFLVPTLLAAQTHRTVIIEDQQVHFVDQDGYAVRGDVILGTVAELEAAARGDAAALKTYRAASIYPATLWTGGVIPYIIDPDVPNPQRILDGIFHWNSRTPLKIIPRTNEANYMRFRRVSADFACAAFYGMRPGEQIIQTTHTCNVGAVVHEIGHAYGLQHEQERLDRNQYVTVLYENIDKRFIYAFDQTTNSRDSGYYDFDSVMHYGPTGFSRNLQSSLESVPVGIPFGNRAGLSAADIDQISRLYGFMPTATTITTIPAGLPITVDGQAYSSPRSFDWAPGSTHSIAVNPRQGDDPLYSLVRWTDQGAAQHDIQVSPDLTVIAAIFQIRHRVTTQVAAGNGTVTIKPPSPDGYYPERLPISVEAVPASGSNFSFWSGIHNLSTRGYGISAPQALVEVDRVGLRYAANFTTAGVTAIVSNPPGRTVVISGSTYTTPVNLITPGNYTMSITPTQMAGNNTTRHIFSGWSDGVMTSTRTFTAGTSNAVLSADFNTQYLLSTSTVGLGTVTVNPSSPDGFYDAGTQVSLSAPGQNIRFWLGDAAGGANSQTVIMDEQRAATAVFASTLPYRLVSAASYLGGVLFSSTGTDVAPFEIATLFGANLGPPTLASGQLDGAGRLATTLANTRVLFDTTPAPIIYAFDGQTSVVVPGDVAGKTKVMLSVERNGVAIPGSQFLNVSATKPALFTAAANGKGPVAAFNQDGTVNSSTNRAPAGSVVTLFCGGGGLMDRALIDGQIMDANLARPRGAVVVKFGKLPGEIFYAGSAPFLVSGALQVNVKLPADLLPGAVTVQLSVGTWTSPPGTTIWVQ